jgi:hypothetical protein
MVDVIKFEVDTWLHDTKHFYNGKVENNHFLNKQLNA